MKPATRQCVMLPSIGPCVVDGHWFEAYHDRAWCSGPDGRLDLFLQFSRRYGSIELCEAIGKLPDGTTCVVYMVPQEKVAAFNNFLDSVWIDLPDGSMCCPILRRPGTLTPMECSDRRTRSVLNHCHTIQALVLPADHPEVKRKRDSLAGCCWN